MGRTAKEKKEQVWSKKIEDIKRKKEQNFSSSWDIAKNGIAVNLVLYKPCSKKRSHIMRPHFCLFVKHDKKLDF